MVISPWNESTGYSGYGGGLFLKIGRILIEIWPLTFVNKHLQICISMGDDRGYQQKWVKTGENGWCLYQKENVKL